MARTIPFDIEIGRVGTVDVAQDLREVAGWRLQEQMIMIVHQAVDMNDGTKPLDGRLQIGEKLLTIPETPEDLPALVASGGNVVEGAWKFDSERACHDRNSSDEAYVICKTAEKAASAASLTIGMVACQVSNV